MFLNYIKIAIRNIKRQKTFSILNIIGLAVGMACCILLLLYIQFEISFDMYHKNYDRIYRVIREDKAFTPAPLGTKLVKDLPEVEYSTRFIKQDNVLISNETDHFLEDNVYWADPEILKIFTIDLQKGNPDMALLNPKSLLISEKAAIKFFKNNDPIGKVLKFGSKSEYIIEGIFSNLPDNSHMKIDYILPYKTYFKVTGNDINHWFRNFSYTYFLLKEGIDPAEFDKKFPEVIDSYIFKNLPDNVLSGIEKPYPRIFFIQSLDDIHLHSNLRQEISTNNNIIYIYMFSAIAILILLIASINYINLTTAQVARRGKEIGVRKVAGAYRKQLVFQFYGESLTLTTIAMIFAIILVDIALPVFNNLVDRQLIFSPLNHPKLFIGLVILTFLVGLLSASLPAVIMSGFKPILILKGTFTKSTKGLLFRNILVLTQFSITIFLIICTLVIRSQLDFIMKTDMGYAKDHIINIPVRDNEIRRNIEVIKNELNKHSAILFTSTSARLPDNIDTFTSARWPGKDESIQFSINYNTADQEFVNLYDIEIIKGRNFSKNFPADVKNAILINETATKIAQFETPIGKKFNHWRGDTGTIVGVMKDFHLRSLHHPIEPLYIFLDPDDYSFLSVKIQDKHIPETIEYIENVINNYSPHYPFEYSFFDDQFDRAYHSEQRMISMFSSFSLLAILLSCMGLLGLVLYSVDHRLKEIGIRKVLGASVPGIIILLSKNFLKWIVISNIIAWPLAWYMMDNWLQSFAYKTEISFANFILAASLAFIISLLTMSYQSIRAALSNPVNTLKYE
jgi:putative ABC transport system permease protein